MRQSHPVKPADCTLDQAERAHIVRTLERCGWRIRGPNGAAEQLDVKPTTLESRMKKLGIVPGLAIPAPR
jgi:transcriptional regulator with GAF, ATPase, and Fis domain